MVDIYVYDKSGDDTSTTGLVGSLLPISCEHEEIGNGMSSVTLVHPYDEGEKWKALQNGNILSVPVRVRTVPAMNSNGAYITSVEKWSVKQGLTKAQRKIYANEKKNKKKGMLDSSWEVYVLGVGESSNHDERYHIKYPKAGKKKRKIGSITFIDINWVEGWVSKDALDCKIEDVDISGGIESICPSGEAMPQLFRIQSVEYDVDSKEITVYAVHISYDLSTMVTVYKNDKTLNAVTALNGIMNGIEQDRDQFKAYTDSANSRTSCDWTDNTAMGALLDPEDGFAGKWDVELVRDDYDLYFLAEGGTNRGIRIEHAKNMTGANMQVNWEELVTVIKPTGVTQKGNPLWLVTDGDAQDSDGNYTAENNSGNYIYSANVSLYGERVKAIECDDCTVEKGKKGVTKEIARQRMTAQANAMFDGDEGVDKPKITMTVNFQELGQTVEYEMYKPLENVYLWDSVVVAAKAFGIEATAKVTRIQLDVLANRVIEVELGDVDRSARIYSWQLPSLTDRNLSAKMLNKETPVVQLSGSDMIVTADQNGLCAATSADYLISAWVGYEAANPEIGSITGVPNGMTVTAGSIVTTGTLPIAVSVAANSTLGTIEQCSGHIIIPVLKPVETELSLNWAKICKGENGEDGSIREFVYKITDDGDITPSIDQTTGHDSPDYVPSGWSDNPSGISAEHRFEWMSYRDREAGLWTAFSDPTLWSVWGEKGADGDGTEYIYNNTASSTAPTIPSYDASSAAYQQPEFLPQSFINLGWTDDPTGVSESYKYEWVAIRKRVNGVWQAFSSVSLWAKYGETGPRGPSGSTGAQGPQGPQGPQGLPGANGTRVYYTTSPLPDTGYNSGDLNYVMSLNDVQSIYRHNGSSWIKVKYDTDTFAARSIITEHLASGCITASMINALEITASSLNAGGRLGNPYSYGSITTSNYSATSGGTTVTGKSVDVGGDLLPTSHAYYSLGGTVDTVGSGRRWKELWLSGTVHANSDRALKKDIAALESGELLDNLTPVRFRMKSDDERLRFGFVAQETKEALENAGLSDAELVTGQDGDMDMAYTELIAVLVEGWQRHEKRINDLENENKHLKSRLDAIEVRLGLEDDGK